MWTRDELTEIRERAELEARSDDQTLVWRQACLDLASAADRLDAMTARIKAGEERAVTQEYLARLIDPPATAELQALEAARHELVTLHGLIAADGAAHDETFKIDTRAVVAALDTVLNAALHTDSHPS